MKSCCVTDVGQKRTMNQDFVYASEEPVGNLPNLFLVADGMGGHQAGDYASRYTVETVVKSIRVNKETNPVRIIRKAIETANRKVREKSLSNDRYAGMGTTLVAATVVDHCIYVANVGDSRLYLINEGIHQITRDHSLVEEMVRIGQIDREQARNHPDKNIITRAVGVRERVSIDFFEIKLEEGDLVLMCSDGLTNMIEDQQIREIIETYRKDLPETALELVAKANENGGRDNIAVVLIEPLACEVEEC